MKMTNWLIMFLLTGLLVLPGCGKPKPPETPVQKALTADMPKLRQAFATASPDLQALVDEVSTGLRYGDFRACLVLATGNGDRSRRLPPLAHAVG